jgi:hypothetical protein
VPEEITGGGYGCCTEIHGVEPTRYRALEVDRERNMNTRQRLAANGRISMDENSTLGSTSSTGFRPVWHWPSYREIVLHIIRAPADARHHASATSAPAQAAPAQVLGLGWRGKSALRSPNATRGVLNFSSVIRVTKMGVTNGSLSDKCEHLSHLSRPRLIRDRTPYFLGGFGGFTPEKFGDLGAKKVKSPREPLNNIDSRNIFDSE